MRAWAWRVTAGSMAAASLVHQPEHAQRDPHEQAPARPRRLVAKLQIDGENLRLLRTGALAVAGFRGSRARAARRLPGIAWPQPDRAEAARGIVRGGEPRRAKRDAGDVATREGDAGRGAAIGPTRAGDPLDHSGESRLLERQGQMAAPPGDRKRESGSEPDWVEARFFRPPCAARRGSRFRRTARAGRRARLSRGAPAR